MNRLLANREFDVKIFGDKVILDEGLQNPPSTVLIPFWHLANNARGQISKIGPYGKGYDVFP